MALYAAPSSMTLVVRLPEEREPKRSPTPTELVDLSSSAMQWWNGRRNRLQVFFSDGQGRGAVQGEIERGLEREDRVKSRRDAKAGVWAGGERMKDGGDDHVW